LQQLDSPTAKVRRDPKLFHTTSQELLLLVWYIELTHTLFVTAIFIPCSVFDYFDDSILVCGPYIGTTPPKEIDPNPNPPEWFNGGFAPPTVVRTPAPSIKATSMPVTSKPSSKPSLLPSHKPSSKPSSKPTLKPTLKPTSRPSKKPTTKPTVKPTIKPTSKPTKKPTPKPSTKPTLKPTRIPTMQPTICNLLVGSFDFETANQTSAWTNARVENSTALTRFLGRFERGRAGMSTVFRNVPRNRSKLVFEFDLYEIDDWEAGNIGALYADVVYLTVNGLNYTLGSYKNEWDEKYIDDWVGDIHYTSMSMAPPSQLGFGSALDQRHRVVVEIPNRYIRADGTITLGFVAHFTDTGEAAGFDNIQLWSSCDDPMLAPTAAPTSTNQRKNTTTKTNNFIPGVSGDPHIKGWNSKLITFYLLSIWSLNAF
jgi:hypothetical protein